MLYIKKSNIPGAGKGLFTDTPIKKGKRILEYTGEIITYKEYGERVKQDRYGYLFYISKSRCIDAYNCPESLGRYSNDAKGITGVPGLSNNAKYEIRGNKCYIISFRSIPADAEILTGYGAEYWRDMKYNLKLEQEAKREKLKKAKAAKKRKSAEA